MTEEIKISNADLGMHYGDLQFEIGEHEKFDDMMQRFLRTFADTDVNEDEMEVYSVWQEFVDADRNATLTHQGE